MFFLFAFSRKKWKPDKLDTILRTCKETKFMFYIHVHVLKNSKENKWIHSFSHSYSCFLFPCRKDTWISHFLTCDHMWRHIPTCYTCDPMSLLHSVGFTRELHKKCRKNTHFTSFFFAHVYFMCLFCMG